MRTKSRPPPQTTSANFDEVKRRFIRQNRDLAKNNSSQSLRIRGLELEVSRLLQTNLELREELLRARNAEHNARKESSKEGVRGFKEEMMAKLRELSGIVEGIEEMRENQEEQLEEREDRRMSILSQMEFRERQPLADLMRDCQMPTIDEDKSHPRRTLDATEIKAIRLSDGSSNGSPDLGPPPVARFECQEPIKFDAHASEDQQETQAEAEVEPEKKTSEEDLPAALSINLETRRKRKDSQPKLELRRHSILPPPSPSSSEGDVSAPTLRTGAKRKLADRDLDKPIKAPSKTDFTFNRKASTEPTKTTSEEQFEPTEKEETVEIQPPAQQSTRRVLGDKSVNMSPRKAVVESGKLGKDDLKKPAQPKFGAAKDRAPTRRPRVSAIPPPLQEPEVSVATIELPPASEPTKHSQTTAPNTPAAPDLFSPTPSEPSVGPNERAPTPPPTGLTNTMTEPARPSRRARSAVNYAEPSLTAKMRRQDKSLMDAVTGLQHHRLAMSASAERKARNAVVVKDEPADEDAWKNLPEASQAALSSARARAASPLESRSGDMGSIDSFAKPEFTNHQDSSTVSDSRSHSQSHHRRRSSSTHERLPSSHSDASLDDAAKKLQELDLYDFKDSSSSSSPPEAAAVARASAAAAAPRAHRRHSSIPKDVSKGVEGTRGSAGGGGRQAGGASRRRSMMT